MINDGTLQSVAKRVLFLAGSAWRLPAAGAGQLSHDRLAEPPVYPYPPMQNLCGAAGAFVAYYLFLAIGQGVFPVLFFTGVLPGAVRVQEPRQRPVAARDRAAAAVDVAFAAAVHHFKPGSMNGFPEGHGGSLGISASTFCKSHFNTVWARG